MKKLWISSALMMLLILPVAAQKNKDILYLKDGNKIFGELQEIYDNKYKIRVNDSTIFTFSFTDVDRYEKAKTQGRGRKASGLGFTMEAGTLIGSQSNTYDTPFSFSALIHYNVNTTNIFGLGTGVEFLGKGFTPIFLEYRKIFHEAGTSPFFFARAGAMTYFGSNDNTTYSWNPQYYLHKDYFGGTDIALGTGVSWQGNGVETNLSFAYRYFRTGYKQTEYMQSDVTYTTNYKRLEIKLGFRF